MISFLFKGVIRDHTRSLFPFMTVVIGVMLTVFGHGWIKGAQSSFIDSSAKFDTGHVKVMSRAYAQDADQVPNDLAYIGVTKLLSDVQKEFPNMVWTPRIKFGGLLDIPDEQGETRAQGPVAGLAINLFSEESIEWNNLGLEKALIRGQLPKHPGEIVISEDFAQSLGIRLGETATLISSTMYGSMAMQNFLVVGTIRFGVAAMDRGAMIADISDIQKALDMQDATGEILGYFDDYIYRDARADSIKATFNSKYTNESDEFSPVMETLSDQSGLADILEMLRMFSGAIIMIFLSVMSIVLWNAGLIGSLRRYGEIGIRLAMGENKGHLYRSLVGESLIIGFFGSVAGTLLGLGVAYYLQTHGFDIGSLMKNASLMLTNVIRARITRFTFVIGFIPGLGATFLGTAIAGIGVYRRQTSRLMKEMDT
jgi:putative ABC transport system permease protein